MAAFRQFLTRIITVIFSRNITEKGRRKLVSFWEYREKGRRAVKYEERWRKATKTDTRLRKLEKLGADFEVYKNGKEAVDRVCIFGREDRKEGALFDYIPRDCEITEMDGFEARKEIRKEEKKRGGVHIPIIELTGHAMAEKGWQMEEAGMGFHLAKSHFTSTARLLEIIQSTSTSTSPHLTNPF